MSKDVFRFEPVEQPKAGHGLKQKVTAVYKLAGFIEKRYRNARDGSPEPYWAYVERGSKETGIESKLSAEALQSELSGEPATSIQISRVGSVFRLYLGLTKGDGATVDAEAVFGLLDAFFDSYTVFQADGRFRSMREETLVITVAANSRNRVLEAAEQLRATFEQDGVGVEHDGHYQRVVASTDPNAPTKDQQRLNAFTRALAGGTSLQEMAPEIRTWWLNRY